MNTHLEEAFNGINYLLDDMHKRVKNLKKLHSLDLEWILREAKEHLPEHVIKKIEERIIFLNKS